MDKNTPAPQTLIIMVFRALGGTCCVQTYLCAGGLPHNTTVTVIIYPLFEELPIYYQNH